MIFQKGSVELTIDAANAYEALMAAFFGIEVQYTWRPLGWVELVLVGVGNE